MHWVIKATWIVGWLLSYQGYANPLVGGVGGAYPTAETSRLNPAHAAMLKRSELYYAPEVYKSEVVRARYPGFQGISQTNSGLGLISVTARPAFIYKLSPSTGIGGFILPPLPISVPIEKKGVPVVVLGQQNSVDLKAKGSLLGAGELTYGKEISDYAFGISVNYAKVGIDATLNASGGGSLADITGTAEVLAMRGGSVRSFAGGKLTLGAALDILKSQTLDLRVDSPLFADGGPDLSGSGSSHSVLTNPFAGVLVGAMLEVTPKSKLMIDLDYKHHSKSQKTFSLVELKEKKRDLYDTLAVRIGHVLRFRAGTSFLSGFRYEPAALGQGGLGEGSRAGFGTMELAQIFAGLSELTPLYEIGLGIEKKFAMKSRDVGFFSGIWTGQIGVTYAKGSIGIDKNGELPGAYLYKKIAMPAAVIWQF